MLAAESAKRQQAAAESSRGEKADSPALTKGQDRKAGSPGPVKEEERKVKDERRELLKRPWKKTKIDVEDLP